MEFRRRRLKTASGMHQVQLRHVPEDHGDGQVLRHEVCSVVLARELVQRTNLLGAQRLQPKAVDVDVTDL